jgi:hypothetical protein
MTLTPDEIVEQLNAGEYTLEEMALLAAKIRDEMAHLNTDDRAPDRQMVVVLRYTNERSNIVDENYIVFFCYAEDADHAEEQAMDAYAKFDVEVATTAWVPAK